MAVLFVLIGIFGSDPDEPADTGQELQALVATTVPSTTREQQQPTKPATTASTTTTTAATTTAPPPPTTIAATTTTAYVPFVPQTEPAPPPTDPPATDPPASNVYYGSCDEARAAGAAPLYRGDPGYRPGLDRDDDGVACENG